MSEWILHIGQLNVRFIVGQYGALGVKFNKSKDGGHKEVFAPAFTKKEIEKYNPKNPQKDFYDARYTGDGEYHPISEVVTKYYDKEKPDVFISAEKMDQMFPTMKEAKVISKQPLSKLSLTNIGASSGYYLLPTKDYDNISAYKKLIEYLGDNFIITNPMRLVTGATTTHTYAIFVDKRQHCLVAMEVLVKAGMQPEPSF